MAENEITRQELYDAIERQNKYIEQIVSSGFLAINQRLDISNGRTSKLEDRFMESEKIIAVLRDRAREAESKAMDAQISATASKWISAVIAVGGGR